MRILYITQKFFPESMAAERFVRQASLLRTLGHEVTVLTTMPNYPEGRTFEGYRGKIFIRESIEGCLVVRVASIPAANHGILMRAASYASFAFVSLVVGMLLKRRDLVIAAVPNPGSELAALLIGYVKSTTTLLEMVDLMPENLPFIGIPSESLLSRCVDAYFRRVYQLVDFIATLGPPASQVLRQKGVSSERILELPNGADDDLLKAGGREQARRDHGWEQKFLVVYAGSFSEYYQVPNIVEAAALLAPSHKSIHFLLLGTGPEWGRAMELVCKNGIDNVSLPGCVPRRDLVAHLQAADLFVFSMVADPAPLPYQELLTAKLCEYLFVGRPVIAVEEGSIAGQHLSRIGAGMSVRARNPLLLAEAVRGYSMDAERMRRESEAAAAYGRSHLSRAAIVQQFERELLAKIAASRLQSSCMRGSL